MAERGRRHISGKGYVINFVVLLLLATLSFGLSFVHFPAGELAVALGIAAVKALLVLLFFMHLVEQRFSNQVVVGVSFLTVALLVALSAADVVSRHTFPARPGPTAGDTFYRR